MKGICQGICLHVWRLGGVFFGGLRGTWQVFEVWVSVYYSLNDKTGFSSRFLWKEMTVLESWDSWKMVKIF